MLLRTPLHEFHKAAGARLVDFAGWEMPLLYRSIVEEHEQTRRSGSLFDVSHMGRLVFTGRDATAFLDLALTRRVADQAVGQSRYSLVCNASGGVLDDVIVSRRANEWLLVCNAANREKLKAWFERLRQARGLHCAMADPTEATAMVALQGPRVLDRLAEVLDCRALQRYHFEDRTIFGLFTVTVCRSGYTGEDGVEMIFGRNLAAMALRAIGNGWDKPESTIKPAGLGARDTLRLEAAMPLYGHELTEQTDPLAAGLGWAVALDKPFIGAESLRQIAAAGPARRLVGLELEGRRIARQGAPVLAGGRPVGEVTSGTFGPTVGKSIALAYVEAAHAAPGTALSIDLRGTTNAAVVVPLPFYKRPR
jgi:aminomethyltransferase